MIILTSAPFLRNLRTKSGTLYAAIPPLIPTKMFLFFKLLIIYSRKTLDKPFVFKFKSVKKFSFVFLSKVQSNH